MQSLQLSDKLLKCLDIRFLFHYHSLRACPPKLHILLCDDIHGHSLLTVKDLNHLRKVLIGQRNDCLPLT